MTYSTYSGAPADAALQIVWQFIIARLTANDIILVVAGGQQKIRKTGSGTPIPDTNDVGDQLPQLLGNVADDTYPIIVVGGVNANGIPNSKAYTDPAGTKLISVYASYSVSCWSPTWVRLDKKIGTSYAAPAVTGMLADWLAVPAIRNYIDRLEGSSFPAKARRFLRDTSQLRSIAVPGGAGVNHCTMDTGTGLVTLLHLISDRRQWFLTIFFLEDRTPGIFLLSLMEP